MKTLYFISLMLLAGCVNVSTRSTGTFTNKQALVLALQLANDKAFELYKCRPFTEGALPRLLAGRWVWTDEQAYGQGDIQSKVSFLPDGSDRYVDVKLLVNSDMREF